MMMRAAAAGKFLTARHILFFGRQDEIGAQRKIFGLNHSQATHIPGTAIFWNK